MLLLWVVDTSWVLATDTPLFEHDFIMSKNERNHVHTCTRKKLASDSLTTFTKLKRRSASCTRILSCVVFADTFEEGEVVNETVLEVGRGIDNNTITSN